MERQGMEVGPRPEGATREHDRRSLGSLFLELTKETSALARAEVTLARLEIEEKLNQIQHGVTNLAAGAAVAFAGVLTLIACAVLALSEAWPAWLSALVVGLGVTAAGACLLYFGRERLRKQRLRPGKTMESLRETKTFAKEQVS